MGVIAAAVLLVGCEERVGKSPTSAGGAGAVELTWQTDLDAALAQAKSRGRTVLVVVTSRQCPWCRRLERETLTDPRVQRRLAGLVLVKMDFGRYYRRARSWGVPGVPTTVALRSDGSVRKMLVGYRPPEDYLSFLDSLEEENRR